MKRLLLAFYILSLLGCQNIGESQNKPIFSEDPPGGHPTFEFRIQSRIEPEVIKPNKIRRFVRRIVGWIPIVGDVFEIPLNIVNVLLPNLSFSKIVPLPGDPSLSDPEVMKSIEHIEIDEIHLAVTPESERGTDYKREHCYLIMKCKDQNLKFIKELVIAIEDKAGGGTWVIAKADAKDLNPEKDFIGIHPIPGFNLKPFLLLPDRFEIRVLLDGRVPKRTLYLEGGMYVKIRMNYGESFSDEDRH